MQHEMVDEVHNHTFVGRSLSICSSSWLKCQEYIVSGLSWWFCGDFCQSSALSRRWHMNVYRANVCFCPDCSAKVKYNTKEKQWRKDHVKLPLKTFSPAAWVKSPLNTLLPPPPSPYPPPPPLPPQPHLPSLPLPPLPPPSTLSISSVLLLYKGNYHQFRTAGCNVFLP